MCLFIVVTMTPSAARPTSVARDISIFSRRHSQFCRKNKPLSSQQFIASEKFTESVVDTGEEFIASVVDTGDKIVPCCHIYLSEITQKSKIYRRLFGSSGSIFIKKGRPAENEAGKGEISRGGS
jgi:hypothetical protein